MTPPELDVRICDAERRSDGAILTTIGRNTRAINETSEYEAVIAIGRTGEIEWTREFDHGVMDCRRTSADTLLVMGTYGRAAEISLNGDLLREWYCLEEHPGGPEAIKLDTLKIHHAMCELADGKIASLSIEHLPSVSPPSPEWTHQMADTVVIFDRGGQIHQEIGLNDLLDPSRHSYSTVVPYYPMQGWHATLDWSHANGLLEDPDDGGLLLSLRHQDVVIKISRDGELVWILGDPTGWTEPWSSKLLRIDGGRPAYHQHDLSFAANGDLLLFDNGTSGAFPPNELPAFEDRDSFALGYRIDKTTMTATETWRYGGTDALPYTCYVSGVCDLPNGNRFIACSGIVTLPDGGRTSTPPAGTLSIEYFEVTPEGEVVFHAALEDSSMGPGLGWNGFRPEHVPVWPNA